MVVRGTEGGSVREGKGREGKGSGFIRILQSLTWGVRGEFDATKLP